MLDTNFIKKAFNFGDITISPSVVFSDKTIKSNYKIAESDNLLHLSASEKEYQDDIYIYSHGEYFTAKRVFTNKSFYGGN